MKKTDAISNNRQISNCQIINKTYFFPGDHPLATSRKTPCTTATSSTTFPTNSNLTTISGLCSSGWSSWRWKGNGIANGIRESGWKRRGPTRRTNWSNWLTECKYSYNINTSPEESAMANFTDSSSSQNFNKLFLSKTIWHFYYYEYYPSIHKFLF